MQTQNDNKVKVQITNVNVAACIMATVPLIMLLAKIFGLI